MTISIGRHELKNKVILAPMSGVTDLPCRQVADRMGCGLVVSEMVASEELVRARPDVVRRAAGSGLLSPLVVQLAGREPEWMAEGARLAEDAGADIIDINMGCPARQVTTGMSGSALMRDLDHAEKLIRATVEAATVPVTLKMRLGWDDATRNAPELAQRAQAAGVQLLTVHGRTRCQFYKGTADWAAIKDVVDVTSLPVVANGDICSIEDADKCLAQSGADAVMVGRGANGRPWFLGQLGQWLEDGTAPTEVPFEVQAETALWHYKEALDHYGEHLGIRIVRKHLGWYIEAAAAQAGIQGSAGLKAFKGDIMPSWNTQKVMDDLARFYEELANGTFVSQIAEGEVAA